MSEAKENMKKHFQICIPHWPQSHSAKHRLLHWESSPQESHEEDQYPKKKVPRTNLLRRAAEMPQAKLDLDCSGES
jgi:hypothetical protein